VLAGGVAGDEFKLFVVRRNASRAVRARAMVTK
jgi:hypothetical protein